MIQDKVDVRYPDGKTRKVAIAVPLHRIRAAVIRNLNRGNPEREDYQDVVFPQIYVSKAYQDDPFTMAEVYMDFNGTRYEGVGFSKRKASDRRHPGVGISIALYRAAREAAMRLSSEDIGKLSQMQSGKIPPFVPEHTVSEYLRSE